MYQKDKTAEVKEMAVIETSMQFVIFTLDNTMYGVDIMKVQEIIKMSDITKIPNCDPFVKGVVNLRGKIIPVLDMGEMLGKEKSEIDSKWKILIIKKDGGNIGVLVENISEVKRIDTKVIEEPSKSLIDKNRALSGIAKTDSGLYMIMDIDRLFTIREKESA